MFDYQFANEIIIRERHQDNYENILNHTRFGNCCQPDEQ